MKKLIVALLFLSVIMTACSTDSNNEPTAAVKDYLEAIKQADIEKMNALSTEDGYYDDADMPQFTKLLFKKMEYEIISSEVSDDKATVELDITNTDMSEIFDEIMQAAISDALTNDVDIEDEQYMMDLFAEKIEAHQDDRITIITTLDLELVDGKWLVDPDEEFINGVTGRLLDSSAAFQNSFDNDNIQVESAQVTPEQTEETTADETDDEDEDTTENVSEDSDVVTNDAALAAKQYLDAMMGADIEKMNALSTSEGQYVDDMPAFTELMFDNLQYEILSSDIDDDEAEVEMNISNIDMSVVFQEMVQSAVSDSLTTDIDTSEGAYMLALFEKHIEENRANTIDNVVDLELELVDGQWLANPDDDFIDAISGGFLDATEDFAEEFSDELSDYYEEEEAQEIIAYLDEEYQEVAENIYTKGDTWLTDDWSLTVNSVTATDERDDDEDEQPAQVVVINYTFENLNYDDDLMIFVEHVLDQNGYPAEEYELSNGFHNSIPVGATSTGNDNYGLKNVSDKVKIYFSYYDSQDIEQKAIFELPVE